MTKEVVNVVNTSKDLLHKYCDSIGDVIMTVYMLVNMIKGGRWPQSPHDVQCIPVLINDNDLSVTYFNLKRAISNYKFHRKSVYLDAIQFYSRLLIIDIHLLNLNRDYGVKVHLPEINFNQSDAGKANRTKFIGYKISKAIRRNFQL